MFKRFRKREDGTATIEFVLALPLVMVIFMSTFESAMLTAKYTMLERALDMVMRDVRLTTNTPMTQTEIRNAICERAMLIDNCQNVLVIETQEIDPPGWVMPDADVECVDRVNDVVPMVSFDQAGPNRLMLIRACALIDPWFPSSGLGLALTKDDSGAVRMFAASAFVAEP